MSSSLLYDERKEHDALAHERSYLAKYRVPATPADWSFFPLRLSRLLPDSVTLGTIQGKCSNGQYGVH